MNKSPMKALAALTPQSSTLKGVELGQVYILLWLITKRERGQFHILQYSGKIIIFV
ncbi:hypothetical protein HMPREF1869_00834 [Bacteroidales bacterium KA00251]|nr:hypothetical protein HMPREF1869_00834 [Bacteroidales bacterium KA00251]